MGSRGCWLRDMMRVTSTMQMRCRFVGIGSRIVCVLRVAVRMGAGINFDPRKWLHRMGNRPRAQRKGQRNTKD